MATTRMVFAVVAIAFLSAGAVATYVDREEAGDWLRAAGFAVASLWGLLTGLLIAQGQADVSRSIVFSLTSIAMVLTLFFVQRARGEL